MQLKWPQDFRFRLHQAPPGASESNAYTEANDSKVGPKARTLDSLDAFDSDPGPQLMDLMDLNASKVAPLRGQDF